MVKHFQISQPILKRTKIHYENENVGFGDFLSSESDALDAFIERKLKEAGHSLSEENKVDVFLNPDNNHIIQRGQGAIVIP